MVFEDLFALEEELAAYTGAPYVVVTDGCTHGIELCLRYHAVRSVEFTAFTYLSIVQTMINLKIRYQLTDEVWQGEYQLHGTNIWDSARRLEPGMYRTGQIQCLSFGHGKPLAVGKCGAILLDDVQAYYQLSQMRSDGRDLRITPWQDQAVITTGWHYCPTLETVRAVRGRLLTVEPQCQIVAYPDCRKIAIRV